MRYGHVIVEHTLITITAFWGICALAGDAVAFTFFIWLLALGFMQVAHSLIIAMGYWNNIKIRTAICIYWVVAVIDLFLLPQKKIEDDFLLIAMQLAIAVYLWGITWYFHRQTLAEGTEKTNNR